MVWRRVIGFILPFPRLSLNAAAVYDMNWETATHTTFALYAVHASRGHVPLNRGISERTERVTYLMFSSEGSCTDLAGIWGGLQEINQIRGQWFIVQLFLYV